MIHARPSEQFEEKEGGLISINKQKAKESKECVAPSKKMMQSWLKKLAKKREETIHDAKKRMIKRYLNVKNRNNI
jgi:hypothetical protein